MWLYRCCILFVNEFIIMSVLYLLLYVSIVYNLCSRCFNVECYGVVLCYFIA